MRRGTVFWQERQFVRLSRLRRRPHDLWKLDTLASAAKAFVMKVNPSATAFVYSAVIGGTGVDQAAGVAVDGSGNAYLAGTTSSADFPVTSGAYQTASGISGSATKGFVAQLSSDGASLGFATYLGGSGTEQINGLALDSTKNIYVTGLTTLPRLSWRWQLYLQAR